MKIAVKVFKAFPKFTYHFIPCNLYQYYRLWCENVYSILHGYN